MFSSILTTAPQSMKGTCTLDHSYSIISKCSLSNCPRKSSLRHRILSTIRLLTQRQDLLGNTLPLEPGQNPGDPYILDVSVMRRYAATEVQKMNLTTN